LESLSKLKQFSLKSSNLPWVNRTAKCILRTWSELKASEPDHALHALAVGDLQHSLRSPPSKEVIGTGTPTDVELGREDGELPSSTALPTGGPRSSGSRLLNGSEGAQQDTDASTIVTSFAKEPTKPPRISVGEKRSRRGEKVAKSAPIQREDAVLAGIVSSLLPGFDALMEDGMDGLEMEAVVEDVVDDPNLVRGRWGWETHGIQRFRAVLRRENGVGGKRKDLEAQVCLDVLLK
jgi:hypothetical protein